MVMGFVSFFVSIAELRASCHVGRFGVTQNSIENPNPKKPKKVKNQIEYHIVNNTGQHTHPSF